MNEITKTLALFAGIVVGGNSSQCPLCVSYHVVVELVDAGNLWFENHHLSTVMGTDDSFKYPLQQRIFP